MFISMISRQLLSQTSFSFFPPGLTGSVAILFIGGGAAFLLAYLFTFGVTALSHKMGWLDLPSARRVHKKPVPRLGGVAIFLAFVIASLVFYLSVFRTNGELTSKENTIYWLFLAGATLIVFVHVYDDIKGLKPLPKLIAQTVTVLIILGPFAGSFHGVLLFGFSNPFSAGVADSTLPWYRQPEITLFIHNNPLTNLPDISWLALPAVLFTWVWMVGMMNTVNLVDGLDGLATGVVGLTALFITIISWTLGQHTIAALSAIFTGAVLGFLPHNWNPAKIIMGDSGSQFLGLALGVLSIMGGAKVALALMVLGIPILDVAIVVINRVRRGQSPLHYDKTHLHHRLLATGLSVRQICYVFYGLTALFGVLALSMQHIYKLIGFGLVGAAMIGLIIWMDYRQRQRGAPLTPDEPGPGSPRGQSKDERGKTEDKGGSATGSSRGSQVGGSTSPPPGSTARQSRQHERARLPLGRDV
ncbi:MAG: undecaprenyl/decaprenyl-phosphate alpha-N-acetylglucosaminyl 1-phosphate transferase [Ktedonobacteraceae bacterium]|nr:undecaprenyl/decaprenyl-phosphate alpha-N-acetylglucosaminyl 1-phosphate transferase [Ktedonobacteraceae bacterium]